MGDIKFILEMSDTWVRAVIEHVQGGERVVLANLRRTVYDLDGVDNVFSEFAGAIARSVFEKVTDEIGDAGTIHFVPVDEIH